MADIRPTSLPATPAPATSPARTAAQRAFFDAAMGRAGSAAPAAEPVKAAAPVAQRTVQAQIPEEPPKKILRPGSLLDIRV